MVNSKKKVGGSVIEGKSIENTFEVKMRKDEKQGIRTLMILYLVSWGILATPWGAMRLVAWVSLGLIGLTLWKVLDKLVERSNN